MNTRRRPTSEGDRAGVWSGSHGCSWAVCAVAADSSISDRVNDGTRTKILADDQSAWGWRLSAHCTMHKGPGLSPSLLPAGAML